MCTPKTQYKVPVHLGWMQEQTSVPSCVELHLHKPTLRQPILSRTNLTNQPSALLVAAGRFGGSRARCGRAACGSPRLFTRRCSRPGGRASPRASSGGACRTCVCRRPSEWDVDKPLDPQYKYSLYYSSTSLPLSCPTPQVSDLLPTTLHLAGAASPLPAELDGHNLWPALMTGGPVLRP